MKKTEQQLEQQAITLGFSIIAILLFAGYACSIMVTTIERLNV
jgi:hypothetical protein